MNMFCFDGRLAAAPKVTEADNGPYVRFTLIRNDYAGKDDQGNAKERPVAIPFVAKGPRGQAIADHVGVGDQLIVEAHIQNNNYEKDGKTVYGFDFWIHEWEFGAKSLKNAGAEPAAKANNKHK